MIEFALRSPDFGWSGELGWQRPARSPQTITGSHVEAPPPSSAASTGEPDSPNVPPIITWVQPVLDRLNHLLELRDGWDGPGTLSVDLGVVERTLRALASIARQNTRPPSIAPGADGSLQLAWYVRDFDLEIDIPRSGNPAAWLYEHSTGEDSELSLASPRLRDVVARLAAR
jgi:hypothetical protein